jgi:DNA-binding transcriptional MerR regulator
MQLNIPDKTYFKIGEVARLAGVNTSVLRYWETEFSFLTPEKSSSGQRLYTRTDIELICQIKQFLYHEKYTIEGVRKKLATGRRKHFIDSEDAAVDNNKQLLSQIREELLEISYSLKSGM